VLSERNATIIRPRIELSVQKEKEPQFIGEGRGLTAANCSSYVNFEAQMLQHQSQFILFIGDRDRQRLLTFLFSSHSFPFEYYDLTLL